MVLHHEALARDSDSRARIIPSAGGSAANLAVWAARAGVEVAFFGQAGDDPVGRQLKADLAAAGVAVDPPLGNFQFSSEAPTGIIIVNVEGNARTMVTDRGANLTVPADLVAEEALVHSGWLHLTGYSFFEPAPRAAALAALAACRRRGLPFSIDPSSYRLIRDYGSDRFLEEVYGATVVFPNLDEARELVGEPVAHGSAQALARSLARRFPVVALKTGAEGCVVAAGDRVETVPPARPPASIDPTGAGDAFAAGFLKVLLATGQSHGWAFEELLEAATAGSVLAAQAVAVVGGQGRR